MEKLAESVLITGTQDETKPIGVCVGYTHGMNICVVVAVIVWKVIAGGAFMKLV